MAKTGAKSVEFGGSSFKKLSVSDKFKKVFNSFRNNLIVIFVVIVVIDAISIINLGNIYHIYYEQNTQQGEIRSTMQAIQESLDYPHFYSMGVKSVINLKRVLKITKDSVVMENGKEFSVPRGTYRVLSELVLKYSF